MYVYYINRCIIFYAETDAFISIIEITLQERCFYKIPPLDANAT